MRILDPGHTFALGHIDGPHWSIMRFVKREGVKYPGNVGHHEGPSLQENWRAEISRIKYLQEQDPCQQNIWALRNLRDNIRFFEERAARRHGRRPDWRMYEKDGSTNDQIEHLPVCGHCGHIGCPADKGV